MRTKEENDRSTVVPEELSHLGRASGIVVVLEEPSHLERALEKVTILGRISFKECNRVKSTIKEEISGKKAVTITLNALHQMNWPYLWGNDT